jgi:serine/threonine-protein kinase
MTVCPDDGWSFTVDVDATYHPPGEVTGGGAGLAVAAAPAIDEPPPSTDLVPGTVVGEYKVDKKIGEGGMGAVYSATHPMIGKRAAIKVISSALGTDASAVNRFVQEARSVNQIGHPNIVDVFAFGELPDGRNYFVMEYLQGESLADRIGRVAMPLGEAIEILDQVADALEAAHEKQIVHRDLKPDNVYLAAVRGGRTMVKLLDFGIAKLSVPDGPGSGGVQKTRTGMMMGTPGYLSPEQARGKNVDHRTDVYALGCMTFEIVCGRLPFIADNAMDIVLMHMTTPPVRASSIWPEIPAPLDDLIARMLEKEAAARPSLAEVRGVFSELVTSGLVTLNNGRGVAFGSGISRLQTPAGGLPRPTTTNSALAVGTQPATPRPGTQPATPRPGTQPGAAAETVPPPTAKKKTALFAALAGVVVLGGVGAFMAMKGGGDKPAEKAPVAAKEPTPPQPTPEPPKPAPEPPKPAVAETPQPVTTESPKPAPGTIEIAINVEKAQVSIDGNPVEVKGKTAKATVEDAGSHVVTVTAAGRDTFETRVETKPGQTAQLVAKLERAKAGAKKPAGGGAKTGSGTSTASTNAMNANTANTNTNTNPNTKPAGTEGKKGPDTSKDAPIDPF